MGRWLSVRRQRGATLIVTMIFLVLLTFLGVSTIQDTTLEEKMASNLRQSDLVFQAAEDALRLAEVSLDGSASLPSFDNTSGHYDENYSLNPVIAAAVDCTAWVCVSTSPITSGYLVQELSALGATENDSLEAGSAKGEVDRVFEITAKAESSATSAVAVVRSIFRR